MLLCAVCSAKNLEPEKRTKGSEELNFLARFIREPSSEAELSKDLFKISDLFSSFG